jgi:D-alanyl-lipoteichoic acid acyltransferase DltB (MBOAT superfamily)
MPFNFLRFLTFLTVVSAVYYALPQRARWLLLLTASYAFYMSLRPEYAIWLVSITLLDYYCGLRMGRPGGPRERLPWLIASICGNLGFLIFFRYAGFFNENARALCHLLGLPYDLPTLKLLVPLGISFHTLQSIGYAVDVYRRTREPETHLGYFALYVSFYPQLLAGPIERSTTLLPQFRCEHTFDYNRAVGGLRLILWGLFKKLIIADRLAVYVDAVYGNPGRYGGVPVVLATYFFAFQIYCDFSGYSDIAVGAAKVLGYDLMVNFRSPYSARSIREFWHRWHISLSSWFRDYVYVPLGGSRSSTPRWCGNVILVFLLSGLWHGAQWTFLVWGLLHAAYYLGSEALARVGGRGREAESSPSVWSGLVTFHLVCFAWIFFRAPGLTDAVLLLRSIGDLGNGSSLGLQSAALAGVVGLAGVAANCALIVALLLAEAGAGEAGVPVYWARRPLVLRWGLAYAMVFSILILGRLGNNEFIYFDF